MTQTELFCECGLIPEKKKEWQVEDIEFQGRVLKKLNVGIMEVSKKRSGISKGDLKKIM